MSKTDNLESLNKISSTVSERDKKIWENEAHSVCIKKAAEELANEITRMKKATEETEKENKILEARLAEITESITVQKETLKTSEQSLLVHRSLKENLIQKRDEMRQKYVKVLQMYEDEYQEYRTIYINNSRGYKVLRDKEIKLKKLKITGMDLDVKITNVNKIRQQFKDLQNQMLRATIIKFAKFYILYHKNARICAQLKESKNEEKMLMKQHFELMKIVKEKQAKRLQERNRNRVANSLSVNVEDKCSSLKAAQLKENKDSSAERLQKFLNEKLKPFSLTSLDSVSQQAEFRKDDCKVRILDMKVMRPLTLQTHAVKKPNLNLRKQMEVIMETTKKNALKANSSQVTPSGSQQSQNDISKTTPTRLSQSSLEKSTPKEKPQINPILKQNKDGPSQSTDEEAAAAKDETISKFFARKKTVTFQNEATLKTSQEENEGGCNNQNNGRVKEKKKNEANSKNVFPFSLKKESIKSVELKSMEVFRKPFVFSNETASKQEKKKCDNFVQNSPFGMFGQILSGEKKKDSSLETEATGNISSKAVFASSNAAFSGPSNEVAEDQPSDPTVDPFEVSFNANFGQTPLNTTNDFTPAPESNTMFNFFGSQNKNNLFTTF